MDTVGRTESETYVIFDVHFKFKESRRTFWLSGPQNQNNPRLPEPLLWGGDPEFTNRAYGL